MKYQYDPDADPVTGLYYNKANISNKADLELFELEVTSLRIAAVVSQPVDGGFDSEHLKAIHYYIFSPVYPWAGQYRTVETSSRARFAKPEHIAASVDSVLSKLQRETFTDDKQYMASKLAYYYVELNAIHPFREGNGRTLCQFVYDVAYANFWNLNWDAITEKQLNDAAAEGMYAPVPKLLTELFLVNLTEELSKKDG